MSLKDLPELKVYILICRRLIYKGCYMLQGENFTYVLAENIDEAVKKLQVIDMQPGCMSMNPLYLNYFKIIQIPKIPPKWYKGGKRKWKKLRSKKLLWEVAEIRNIYSGDLDFFCPKRIKIKKIKDWL